MRSHDEIAALAREGRLEETTQDERRHYCIEELGMPPESIGDEEIPCGVFYIDNRPLTVAEKAYAPTLIPTR